MGKLIYFIWKTLPFYLWSIVRNQKAPADTSNRLWKPILLWIVCTRYEQVLELTGWNISYSQLIWRATTREDMFVEYMPFLKYDLWELLIVKIKQLK